MVLTEAHRTALEEWFDAVVVDIQTLHPGAQKFVLAAVANDEKYERLQKSNPKPLPTLLQAVRQLRAVNEHPYPQNRRLGCPGLPVVNGFVQFYSSEGKLEREPVGLLSLTQFDTPTDKVTREDVVNYVHWRLQNEEEKLHHDRVTLEGSNLPQQLAEARKCISMLQLLVRRREESHQHEIQTLHTQCVLHLAALGHPPNADVQESDIAAIPNGIGHKVVTSQVSPPKDQLVGPEDSKVAPMANGGNCSVAPGMDLGANASPSATHFPANGISLTLRTTNNSGSSPLDRVQLPAGAAELLKPPSNSELSALRVTSPTVSLPTPPNRDYEVITAEQDEIIRQQQAHSLRELRRAQEAQFAKERLRPPVVPDSVGLENPVGAHNCFLNVVLQSLWHLGDFRRLIEQRPEHRCRENCIFCSISNLFTQYKFGNYAHMPPKEVREVVSRLFMEEGRFQMDKMDDAAEMLDAMLQQLHLETSTAADLNGPCQPACVAHAVFAAEIIERSARCPFCKQVGDHLQSYISQLHYFPASLLGKDPLEQRLKLHFESEICTCKVCEKNEPNRNVRLPIHKFMCNLPRVFACVLAWDGESTTREELHRVTGGIPQVLYLQQIFRLVTDAAVLPQPYYLRGTICFYGRHYVAYFWNRTLERWVFMDDSNVRPVGDWQTVRQTIIDGRQMPLVLFFVKSDGPERASSPNPPITSSTSPPATPSGGAYSAPEHVVAERRSSAVMPVSPRPRA